MRKRFKMALCAAVLTAAMGMTAYAGQWKSDAKGWWWQEDDGTYPANTWKWLDGNQDGVSECYYFGQDGYMLVQTATPDGYQVNGDGAWVKDGAVQTQGGKAAADTERYTVIGGPNRLAPPNGLQGIYPFDMNLYHEFKTGAAHIGTHTYQPNEFFIVPVEQYTYNGENFSLGADHASGGSAYDFPGKWVVDNTKPDAVNGKTNIRFMYDDGTFAGYGFHSPSVSETYIKENEALRLAQNSDYLKFSGKASWFFAEDGYMYRNCYIGTTSTKMGYNGSWIDRDYH